MRLPFLAFFALLALLATFSCKTVEDDFVQNLNHEYLALEVGKYIIYEVDSTIYDPTGDSLISFSKTFIKDEIVDTFLNDFGDVIYKTERFERKEEGDPWQVTKVFTQSIEGNKGIVTEDNLRFVKLTFPLRKFDNWDGLVHINPDIRITVAGETLDMFLKNTASGRWRNRVLSVDEPDSVGLHSFENVMTMREIDYDEGNLHLRISREKYAKGVGLVYRERWILDSDRCESSCNPLEIIYNVCLDDCFFECMATGTLDSAQCVSQCEVDCIDSYSNFNNCIDACSSLIWTEKATKGFILSQKVIKYN